MFRRDLAEYLFHCPLSVLEIARQMGLPVKTVADDLAHLARSLRHGDRRLVVHPAACRKCGFTFGTDKLTRPGKCPKCRGTWVSDPLIEVVER